MKIKPFYRDASTDLQGIKSFHFGGVQQRQRPAKTVAADKWFFHAATFFQRLINYIQLIDPFGLNEFIIISLTVTFHNQGGCQVYLHGCHQDRVHLYFPEADLDFQV